MLRDLFNTTAFSMGTLTASINEPAYVPQGIASLGIFEDGGVATTSVSIEKRGQLLMLLNTKPRGAPGTPMVNDKRTMVTLGVPHIPADDALVPDEIQGVRVFGSPDQMEGVTTKRDEKLARMQRNMDATLEFHRLGALQGLVLDADGSTIFDLFDEFGVDQPGSTSLHLNDAWTADDGGVIRAIVTGVYREIRDVLGGVPIRGMVALCGDAFYDKLVNHPEVRQTYINQAAANDLREDPDPFDSFNYGGVKWTNYRGFGIAIVDDNECQFVPLGVPGLFITRFAPADWFSAVNTIGLPYYSMATLDPSGEKRIDMEAQSNPICLCTRPDALFKGTIS